MGDDDDLLVHRHGPQLEVGAAHQLRHHPELDGVEVGESLAQPGLAGPQIPQLQCLELVRGLGTQLVVADQRLDRREKLLVLRHENLGVEDACFLGPGPLEHALPEVAQLAHHFLYRIPQPLDLLVHLVGTVWNPALDSLLWGQVDRLPLEGNLPTDAWTPGRLVPDRYALPVDPNAPPGTYSLAVGLYDALSGERLPVYDAEGGLAGDQIVISEIEVLPLK